MTFNIFSKIHQPIFKLLFLNLILFFRIAQSVWVFFFFQTNMTLTASFPEHKLPDVLVKKTCLSYSQISISWGRFCYQTQLPKIIFQWGMLMRWYSVFTHCSCNCQFSPKTQICTFDYLLVYGPLSFVSFLCFGCLVLSLFCFASATEGKKNHCMAQAAELAVHWFSELPQSSQFIPCTQLRACNCLSSFWLLLLLMG